MTRGSGFDEDLFGADTVGAVDGAGTDEVPVGVDDIAGRTGAGAARRADGFPGRLEAVAVEAPDALLDGAGDEPFDDVFVRRVGGRDHDGARVLVAGGVDTVDGVGADDAGPVHDLASGSGARGQGEQAQGHDDEGHDANHVAEGTGGRGLPRWSKVLLWFAAVLGVAVLAFAIVQPIKVLPRIRVAPGYALTDQSGASFNSETVRGTVTLYSFAPLECGEACEQMAETMREVQRRLPAEVDLGEAEYSLVTIALADAPSPEALTAAAGSAGADGPEWRWIGGEWDRVRTVVGTGFRRYFERIESGEVVFDPGFVLVDGDGVIRGEYKYQTLASDADKLVRQFAILGDEIRLSHGVAGLAYEAAHLFSCYG